MNKKVLVIVGLAAVIAVSGGVISLTGAPGHVRGADGDPAASTSSYVDTDNDTDEGYTADDTENAPEPTEAEETPEETSAEDDTELKGDDVYGYSDDIVSVTSYTIASVIDHTTNRYTTAREAFGSLYYYCYLAFKSDGTMEICISPESGEIRKGRYAIYSDVISVQYDDGGGAEYDVISNNSGGVDYIVVRYGDYDVYFG